jgi:alkaline phosphatase D
LSKRPSPAFRISLALVGVLMLSAPSGAAAAPPAVTHGVASGDVTARSAVIWTRADSRARVRIEYAPRRSFKRKRSVARAIATQAGDYSAKAGLRRLRPNTLYRYRVFLSRRGAGRSRPAYGSFRTAPERSRARRKAFVVGGDLGGQRFCRRPGIGYAVFSRMRSLAPDFFIANGDMVYADNDCPPEGPDGPGGWENLPGDFVGVADPSVDWTNRLALRENYRQHWRYNRGDPLYKRLLRTTPMYSQWDDHEVINDFGGRWPYRPQNPEREGFPNLVAEGRKALFDWSPLRRASPSSNRIYRSFNYGSHLDLFLLDQRSYRSPNTLQDTPENRKTLLGPSQLRWIKRGLTRSKAAWKVVSGTVPLSVPTGSVTFGRDSWASGTDAAGTGFERELLDLLRYLDQRDVRNFVFVATDVHFAQSTRYRIDADGDGDALVFHEFLSGPLSAMPLSPRALDPTLNPTVLYAQRGVSNFAYLRVRRQRDRRVHLVADVRGGDGRARPGSVVNLAARRPRARRRTRR